MWTDELTDIIYYESIIHGYVNTKRTPVIKGCKFSKRNKKQDKNVSQLKKVMICLFVFFLRAIYSR